MAIHPIVPAETNAPTTAAPVPELAAAPAQSAPTPALFSLAGTVTIITGGGRGLGQALAKGIAQAGGSIACIDVLPEPTNAEGEWDEVVRLAGEVGGVATYHVCDITDEALMEETFGKIEGTTGAVVRGVIACAGVQQMVPAVEYPMDGFRRIMEIKSVKLGLAPGVRPSRPSPS